ncbi:MAG TPA: glycosyltransferase 87 family protein [Puia sp.]
MSPKRFYVIFIIVCAIVFAYAAYRDIRYGAASSGDLRNRVVAARLEKDGKLPYFYKWQQGDGLRYYDPQNFDSLAVSNITASPFFHQLLYPLAEWDEQRIKGWWLILEYGMLVLMTGMAFSLAGTDLQRGAVLAVTCLFLLTDAWKAHVDYGQNYICISFFAMVCYFFIRKRSPAFYALMAGILAIMLVLIRPNAVFFFIPFLFLLPTYDRRQLIFFLIPVFLLTAWTVTDKNERALWQDYRLSMVEHLKEHQNLHPAIRRNDPDPHYPRWEGVDVAAQDSAEAKHPVNIHSENGNIFVIVRNIFHRKISPALLFILSLCSIFLLTALFYFQGVRKGNYAPAAVAILGYCLYMISDLFSPVYRHQYYTLQYGSFRCCWWLRWFAPLSNGRSG